MIVLFTDFGADDIYVAQVKAALYRDLSDRAPVVDLLHSVPAFNPRAGAHLLAALHASFPPGAVFVAVVDPGVGTDRDAVAVQADGRWFVGPDNGLLSVVAARAAQRRVWRIDWRPRSLSASFHGRDLFAPMAAAIAGQRVPAGAMVETGALRVSFGADDLAEIVYVDHYGNALTGLRATALPRNAVIEVGGVRAAFAPVFGAAPPGCFWYENSIGLVEVAANGASTARMLGIEIGEPVRVAHS
jgi:S-adenosylmethionine hydrolase